MEVHFYEKPGCINNIKQKKLLEEKGHRVRCFNILEQKWTEGTLFPFLRDLPIKNWFNSTSPRIKSGEIFPEDHDEISALNLLMDDHLLIRRPLIWAKGQFACGFDSELAKELVAGASTQHLLICPNTDTGINCND